MMYQPSRRKRHEDHPHPERKAGDQLQTDGHEPGGVGLGGASAADVVGAVVDPEGDHDAGSNGELLEGDKGAADFRGGDFSVVVGDVDGHCADGETFVLRSSVSVELKKRI